MLTTWRLNYDELNRSLFPNLSHSVNDVMSIFSSNTYLTFQTLALYHKLDEWSQPKL